MNGTDLDQERRITRLEGTVAWIKWVLITSGGALITGAITGAVTWLVSKL